MKIIYALIISIVLGTVPIIAQQEPGADDPLFAPDLVCNANATPKTQVKGFPTPSSTLGPSPKSEPGSNEAQPENANTEIMNNMITQDSILQISDPYYSPETADPTAIDAFFLYPNPTSGIVQVKLSGRISVLIYTISGQLIKKYTLAHGERFLDLNDLPAGIYQVRAKSDEDYFSGKLLIQ